jgi:Ala-tRNA(Pro) deacylase
MIPAVIAAYLRDRYPGCVYRLHPAAQGAADLAAFDGIAGPRVAKVVVLRLGDRLAMAVVALLDRVDLRPVEELTGTAAALAGDDEVADRFRPCEPGAAVPIALFRVPILADDRLLRSGAILFPAGTAVDAAVLDTSEWRWRERIQPVTQLGRAGRRRWRVEPSPGAWAHRPELETQPWREGAAAPDVVSGPVPARSGS